MTWAGCGAWPRVPSPTRARVEPLEPGLGYTLGSSLRRTVLSSIPGAAVTSIRIDGVLHEFTTVPGIKEDVTRGNYSATRPTAGNLPCVEARSGTDHASPHPAADRLSSSDRCPRCYRPRAGTRGRSPGRGRRAREGRVHRSHRGALSTRDRQPCRGRRCPRRRPMPRGESVRMHMTPSAAACPP
ncbi:hypothetical protein [Streptomyces sp. NBC_00443]|uniref:hypothetical protein n=1 Tax=Streptomyces sp. NBC_00443 TaxID=2975743 RepID=UPI002E1AEB00